MSKSEKTLVPAFGNTDEPISTLPEFEAEVCFRVKDAEEFTAWLAELDNGPFMPTRSGHDLWVHEFWTQGLSVRELPDTECELRCDFYAHDRSAVEVSEVRVYGFDANGKKVWIDVPHRLIDWDASADWIASSVESHFENDPY